MNNALILTRRATSLLAASVLALAAITPLMFASRAGAYAQMTERSITIPTSEVSAVDGVYTVSFKPATTGNIRESL